MNGRTTPLHPREPARLVLGAEVGPGDARVQYVRRHAGAFEATRELVGEHDVRQLRLVVRPLPRVVARALQVVEVDPSHRLGAGRHRDHPRGRTGLQSFQEQVGQQEGGQVVDGEGVFQAVHGDVPVGPEPADVVDQHVEAGVCLEHLRGEPAHLRLGGHVGDEHVHRVIARCRADVGCGGLGAGGVAPDDADSGAHSREPDGGGLADPAGAAGDQHGPAGHRTAGLVHRLSPYVSALVSARP